MSKPSGCCGPSILKTGLRLLLLWSLFSAGSLAGQTGAETYVWPKDPAVLTNLHKWQGYKFGLLIHMGLYSELGTIESWGLCPEDWVKREVDYETYSTNYRNARYRFNPAGFDPDRWARLFKGSRAKYMIFSAKHHDGFCLYDSKYTDFKVTDKSCPFSTNPRADILKEVLEATRKEGLAVGVYFSKPDWTSPYFWKPGVGPTDRNPNYDITREPARWRKFVEYTQDQIQELMTGYGKVDILWLDGCWVLPRSAITPQVAEFCKYPHDLDINMKLIAERARIAQPGLLVVDRWVQGDYEDYLTPEQKVPERPLPVPWESCISLGRNWGWVKNDEYKSPKECIQLLVNVVAKGGNLLLGIGPTGKGEFEPKVYETLESIGKWLGINGEAIYGTTPVAPYVDGQVAYTAKGKDTIYALYMPRKDEKEVPASIVVKTGFGGHLKVSLLASGRELDYRYSRGLLTISMPEDLRAGLAAQETVVLKVRR
jgi:alpha-L-fucosidase